MNGTLDQWNTGDAYEQFMGRWSRQIAKKFIRWLAPAASWSWLEVGCGTGALTEAICRDAEPGSVVACDPSPQFVAFARRTLTDPAIKFLVAGAEDLPTSEAGFDAVVSGLVLNFIPDPAGALRAMYSRLRPGGVLASYVWDYAEGMQFLQVFWEAARELDSQAAELDEGKRFPLCRPEALVDLFTGTGLYSVTTHPLEINTPFPDFESYWAPFLGGTGPAPAYVNSLSQPLRERLMVRLRQRLAPTADSPLQLKARAWAVRGYLERAGNGESGGNG